MAKKFNKETLFDDYFNVANQVFTKLELVFDADGVWSKIFGVADDNKYNFVSPDVEQAAKDYIRSSSAWQQLSALYDYAVDGIEGNNHPLDIVLCGAEVLSFIKTDDARPSDEWHEITALGDGRFALDDGQSILIEKLALLANVDIRTVRNAISSGELIAYKKDDFQFVENTSARSWLNGRRGFKRTLLRDGATDDLKQVSSPTEFGAFLVAQRKKNGLDGDKQKLVISHPSADAKAVQEIEAGVFRLPLDTVFPLADFYQLDRKEFLSCVMRVFFEDQLLILRESLMAQ